MVYNTAKPLALSGVQYEIAYGSQRAVVASVGATLRMYSVSGTAVIAGFGEDEICASARGQVLAPWPNRIRDGIYSFNGKHVTVPINEPERHNAIHGLVRHMDWQLASIAQNYCCLSCTLAPQPAYPWWLNMEVEYKLARFGLAVKTVVSTPGGETVPFGLGFHPYLDMGGHPVAECLVRVPATDVLLVDDRMVPSRAQKVAGSQFDLNQLTVLGGLSLDTSYAGLVRDSEGITSVCVSQPFLHRDVTIWMDHSFKYVQLYTADDVTMGEDAGKLLAVEPMTCSPNAFQSQTDVVEILPGTSWRALWGISTRET
ncbi:MAG: aldose 1-epimerase family protein [Acidimicrobiales bacterium]